MKQLFIVSITLLCLTFAVSAEEANTLNEKLQAPDEAAAAPTVDVEVEESQVNAKGDTPEPDFRGGCSASTTCPGTQWFPPYTLTCYGQYSCSEGPGGVTCDGFTKVCFN